MAAAAPNYGERSNMFRTILIRILEALAPIPHPIALAIYTEGEVEGDL